MRTVTGGEESKVDRVGVSVIVLCLLLILGATVAPKAAGAYIPTLQIVGDIENALDIRGVEGLDLQTITYGDRTLHAVSIDELLKIAKPRSRSDVIYSAPDLAARVDASLLANSYLAFTPENGWEVLNFDHPTSSNIKRLEQIIAVAHELEWDDRITIISPIENVAYFSIGQLHASSQYVHWEYNGSATFTHDTVGYTSSVYTKSPAVTLSDLAGEADLGRVLVVGGSGEMAVYKGGMFLLRPNHVDFVAEGRRGMVKNVKGIILNSPVSSNSDAFHDALHFLGAGRSVLLVILDGFGYHQYAYASDNGYLPFMSSLGEAQRVLSVYQPVTNAGLASILTGVGPEQNGVMSRNQRSLTSQDLFEVATEMGKMSAYIVGDRQIINVSMEPVYNLDLNQSGSTDDEILATTLLYAKKDVDLVVAHFKDIDRSGHTFGDLSLQTMLTIAETDRYLEELITSWDGMVIVAVDHGMHSTLDGGGHGLLRYEDMFVPYFILEGGKR